MLRLPAPASWVDCGAPLAHPARGDWPHNVCGCAEFETRCAGGRHAELPEALIAALLVRSAGLDLETMRVVRLDNKTGAATALPDVLTGVKYSTTAWTPDNKARPMLLLLSPQMRTFCKALKRQHVSGWKGFCSSGA